MSYILDAMARSHATQSEVGLRKLSKRSLWQQVTIGLLLLGLVGLMVTTSRGALPPLRAQAPQEVAAAPLLPSPQAAAAMAEVPTMSARSPDTASAPAMTLPASAMAPRARSAPALPVATTTASLAQAPAPVSVRAEPRFRPPTALSQPLPDPSPLGPGGAYTVPRTSRSASAKAPLSAPSSAGEHVSAAPLTASLAAPRDTPEPRPVALAEMGSPSALPPQMRAALSQMKVKVLFHTPQRRNRFVMIDNRELREGDELFDGLRVEEITHAGLVVRHKDTLVLAPTLAAR